MVEINQAQALAGGVTAGDTPGFPVNIGTSGSYRLTGNLTGTAGVDVIEITASDVTLNLNGFALVGGRNGVLATSAQNITVVNGTVRDMSAAGIEIGDNGRSDSSERHAFAQFRCPEEAA